MLSDIVGDPLDMIVSGPTYPDSSTCADAREGVGRYCLRLVVFYTNIPLYQYSIDDLHGFSYNKNS